MTTTEHSTTATAAPSATSFDPGPLSWVMVEIREALARSRTALLEAGGRAPEDQATQLQLAKTHLHQAHGALQMVDVDGVGRITELAETALDHFKSGAVKCSTDNVEMVTQLYQALVAYLDELLAGAPSQPARLYPYYRAVLQMTGAERIHPADLFFPDLARAADLAPLDPQDVAAPDYAACRQRFERALLPYLKSPEAAQQQEHAAVLQEAVAAVAAGQSHASARAFWLALQAFAELVASGEVAGSVQVKQLFGMINLQLRRLSQGNATQPEAMLRDALFFIAVAGAGSASATARTLYTAFALDGLAPADYDTRRYDQTDTLAAAPARTWQDAAPTAHTADIKAALRQVEHALDAFHADPGQRGLLGEVAPALDALHATLAALDQPAAAQAARQVQAAIDELGTGTSDAAQQEQVLGDVVQNVSALGFFADLLAQNAAGARERFAFDAEQGSFRAVPFTKIAGAETIPVLDQAVPAPPPAATPPDLAPAADTAANAPQLLELFIAEARESLDFVDATLAGARQRGGNEEQLITLRRAFNTLKAGARTVALDDFADGAQAVERVMNTWLAEERPVDESLYALLETAARELRTWVDQLAAEGATAPLAAPAQALAAAATRLLGGVDGHEAAESASESVLDSDEQPVAATVAPSPLLAIFLEEAGQLVDRLHQDFGAWRLAPHRPVDPPSLHAAHTLAGISGTVGVAALRELALALEDTLEALQPPAPHLDPAQHDLLDFVVQRMRQMIASVADSTQPDPQPELIAALTALRGQLHTTAPAAGAAIDAHLDQLVAASAEPDETPLDAMFREVYELLSGSVPESAAPAPAPKKQPKKAEPRIDDDIDDLFNAAFDDTFADPPLHIAAPAPAPVPEPEPEPEPVIEAPSAPSAALDAGIIELPLAAPPLLDTAPAIFNDELDADLLPVFLEEGADLLPQVGAALRAWQSAPADTAQAQGLLRLLHTIKGSARMAGAMRLGQHVHDLETHIQNMVHAGSATPQAFEDLLAHYDHALLLFEQLQHPAGKPDTAADNAAPCVDDQPANARSPVVRVRADILDRLVNQAGEVSIARSRVENEVAAMRASLGDVADNLARLNRQLREIEMQAESQIASSMSRMAEANERDFDPLEFDRFTRLQELTRMMAESVNDAASLHEHLARSVDHASDDLVVQARLTRDLQRDLMRVRMVPFASIGERLFRVARQSAKEVDKRVNLDIRGGGVEIDRSVLERMAAPFEHLLRNAIAHGIETRAARTAAGKNETGELLVEVTQQGNEVVIDFTDDGAGLDLDRIRAKGVANGLLAEDEAVTDAQVADLIFEPGFTTAEALTELSGRGVGMDIVQSEAQSLGGRVDLESTPGQGTHFVIRLPLTLAVTQVVLVIAGGRTWALPSILVEQVLQVKQAVLAEAQGVGHLALHGHQAALHYLPALLGEPAADGAEPAAQTEVRSAPVLLLKNGNERLALRVDEVVGNREVVVKNIGPQLARMAGIAGATVLGSGDIVLILNPVALVQHLAQHPEARQLYAQAASADTGGQHGAGLAPAADARTVMVVDDSMTVRRVTQRLLEREGYHVLLAKDGVDALEQLQGTVPDLLLLDIEMPRMDGFDLTRHVRGDERIAGIPIIMITSRSADKHRNYALELGVDAFFGKPFQEPELLAEMTRLLN
jgi:chemosensory pili system protein ChpA (sensor histidine kinase/response regulator)